MDLGDDWVEVEPNGLSHPTDSAPFEHCLQEKQGSAFEVVHRNVQSNINTSGGSNATSAAQRIPKTDFKELCQSIKDNGSFVTTKKQPVFALARRTDISKTFLNSLDQIYQDEMDCYCCKLFMKRYGRLAMVDPKTGELIPLFWNENKLGKPNIFLNPVSSCVKFFSNKKASNEFRIREGRKNAGVEERGGFKHMHFEFPPSCVDKSNSAKWFARAQVQDLAAMLNHILKEFNHDTVNAVAKLILEDKLPYASQHKASIEWLKDLWDFNRIDRAQTDTLRHNLLFHFAASSFVGCINQLRSGALSTILTNVKEGKSGQEIRASWMALTNPRNYMRPEAHPSVGQIDAAERLFANLGFTADDMRRKYAVNQDIPENAFLYKSSSKKIEAKAKSSVFGHLLPVERQHPSTNKYLAKGAKVEWKEPEKSISFSDLVHKVLPTAKLVEFKLPESCYLYLFVTGLPGSKPLMQWHSEENRVSWYTHSNPAEFPDFELKSGWTRVESIVGFPNLWPDMTNREGKLVPIDETEIQRYSHRRHGLRYLIQLQGLVETRWTGLCLFPSMLKSEFHGARSTIEAHSREGRIEPAVSLKGDGLEYFGGVALDSAHFSRSKGKSRFLFKIVSRDGDIEIYRVDSFS